MNEIQLSKRLMEVVNEVPKGGKVADIGSDHAYLPCYAILHGLASKAIAGEVVEGPYQSACAQVRKCELEDKISVRKGNGLDVLQPNEVDAITIAGMGGALIRDILEKGKDKLEGVQRLILQPNIAAHNIRTWMMENEWEIIKEKIIKEDGKIYEILVGERGCKTYSEEERVFGPFLLAEKNDVFIEKWTGELENLNRVIKQMEGGARTEESLLRKKDLEERINLIGGILSE